MRTAFLVCALMMTAVGETESQATAAAALALSGVDKLLERVESINIYYGGNLSKIDPDASKKYQVPWGHDYGLEFAFHLGDWGDIKGATSGSQRRDSLIAVKLHALEKIKGAGKLTAADSSCARALAQEPPFEVTGITVKKHLTIAGKDTVYTGVDSELVGTRKKPPVEKLLHFDLGIGYGQLDAVRAFAPYELRGYVRELPSVSLYTTMRVIEHVGVYSGARTGIISLQDAQLFVPKDASTNLVSLSATTFETGFPLGIDLSWADAHLTVEASYTRRSFNTISFNPSTNFPTNFPHSIDLSGWSWDLGITMPIPKKS